jgi:hypothetical protein
MKLLRIVAPVLILAAAACASGGVFPDTDVVEPSNFELKLATQVQKSGGLLQAGTLEYAGTGDLNQIYRDYVKAMRGQGWVSGSDEINGGKAVGTLRKDNRTCMLEFTSAGGQVRAVIKVSQTK